MGKSESASGKGGIEDQKTRSLEHYKGAPPGRSKSLKGWPTRPTVSKLAARKARSYFAWGDKHVVYRDFDWRIPKPQESIFAHRFERIVAVDIKSVRSATTESYVKTVNKLIELLELPGGWNSYSARPISKENVTFAVGLLAKLMREDTPVPQVVPKVRGGVRLEWHMKGINIEIDVDSPDSFSFFAEDLLSEEEPIEEEIDEFVLSQWIDRLLG